ncbi:MAG: peptidase, partial [Acidobacteria bacterium]|nr:peptidase [Acidobacteriota bacterium]
PGFCTRPDSRAMAAFFIARGDAETAALFRPSSMELVRSLGGDPLTLVSEMPLFLMDSTPPGDPQAPPYPTGTDGRLAFLAWARQRRQEVGDEAFREEARRFGIRPMPLRDQMRLQLAFLAEGLAAAAHP